MEMTFVCYAVAIALLGTAYQWPDLCLLLAMAYAARFVLR
jgi:hypothetical protein